MRCPLRDRFAASFVAAVLLAAPVAAEDSPAKLMANRIPKLCAELQQQGWGVPSDLLKMNPNTKAEMSMGELFYMCSLERQLAGNGPGRTPDLTALLTGGPDKPGLILSANIWCAADREPALEALAQVVELALGGCKLPVPPEVLEAIRASRNHETTADGVRYKVGPIEVDAGACARVQPGMLGPVLMKMDVAVEPAP